MSRSVRLVVKSDKLPQIATNLTQALEDIINKGTNDVASNSVGLTPVDTGTLVNSREVEVSGTKGRVSWGAEYAAFVNFGTYRMAPQPFASDAAAKVFPTIKAALENLEGRL